MKIVFLSFSVAAIVGCTSPPSSAGGRSLYGSLPLQVEAPVFSTYESKRIVVEIHGDVLQPQAYSLPQGSTVSDAIRRAGGFNELGRQSAVRLDRKGGHSRGGKTFVVDMRQVRKDWRNDLVLEEGDSVYVPRAIAIR